MTASECAARWKVSERQALEWLEDFEQRGYAKRCGRFWYPTRRARALHLVDRDGVPV